MEIKKIILNGCSFVHGFDLCYEEFGVKDKLLDFDDAYKSWTVEQKEIFARKRLSGKLKSHFNCEVVDLSKYGESNEWIANNTISYLEENKNNLENTLVLIGWTDIVRTPYFLSNRIRNISVGSLDHYIEWISKVEPSEATMEDLKIYQQLKPLKQIWDENPSMLIQCRDRHLSLVIMMQLYLEKLKLNHCMWNSLSMWPIVPDYNTNYSDYRKIVNWNNWWPKGNKESYENSWDELIWQNPEYFTATRHPNEYSVNNFSKKIISFIENKIKSD